MVFIKDNKSEVCPYFIHNNMRRQLSGHLTRHFRKQDLRIWKSGFCALAGWRTRGAGMTLQGNCGWRLQRLCYGDIKRGDRSQCSLLKLFIVSIRCHLRRIGISGLLVYVQFWHSVFSLSYQRHCISVDAVDDSLDFLKICKVIAKNIDNIHTACKLWIAHIFHC